jgi:hypothetical protein
MIFAWGTMASKASMYSRRSMYLGLASTVNCSRGGGDGDGAHGGQGGWVEGHKRRNPDHPRLPKHRPPHLAVSVTGHLSQVGIGVSHSCGLRGLDVVEEVQLSAGGRVGAGEGGSSDKELRGGRHKSGWDAWPSQPHSHTLTSLPLGASKSSRMRKWANRAVVPPFCAPTTTACGKHRGAGSTFAGSEAFPHTAVAPWVCTQQHWGGTDPLAASHVQRT